MNIFEDTNYQPIPLFIQFVDRLDGFDELNKIQSTETLWSIYARSCTLPKRVNFDKIMAIYLVLTGWEYWTSQTDFHLLSHVLNNTRFDFDYLNEPLSPAEVAWSLTQANLVRPVGDSEDPIELSDNVRYYIGTILDIEGIEIPEEGPLSFGLSDNAYKGSSWSDDPDLTNSILTIKNDKNSEINEYLNFRIQQLSDQLVSLKLKNGSIDGLVKDLGKRN